MRPTATCYQSNPMGGSWFHCAIRSREYFMGCLRKKGPPFWATRFTMFHSPLGFWTLLDIRHFHHYFHPEPPTCQRLLSERKAGAGISWRNIHASKKASRPSCAVPSTAQTLALPKWRSWRNAEIKRRAHQLPNRWRKKKSADAKRNQINSNLTGSKGWLRPAQNWSDMVVPSESKAA